VGSASVGSASVGAASVGAAAVPDSAVPGHAAPGTPPGRPGGRPPRPSPERGNGAAAVPLAGESPVVGARAGAARAAGSLPDAAEPAGGLSGLRHRIRGDRRLRMVTLVTLAVVVLVVLPAIFGIRTATKDPVFSSLDSLDVPAWAAKDVDDQSYGSRWCFFDCRFRERIAQSDKPFQDTTRAYTAALTSAGWRPWKVADCPETPVAPKDGTYSCWTRDEFTLDLWVRLPECAVDQVAARDPAVAATAPVDEVPEPGTCVGSTVSIKVQNAIGDSRGEPQPPQEGPLVGETPDPVISDDPLLQPTPTAS
jgi:integrin beta 3